MAATDFSDWVGKTKTEAGMIGEDLSAMLNATLRTADDAAPVAGEVAGLLWHWTAFNPKVPMDQLAEDGHPKKGGFLPPVDLPRRMWAGGDVTFLAPIHVGHALRQVSTIRSVDQKSDVMSLVTVDHEIWDEDTLAITEEQNIVYLEIPEVFTPPKARPMPEDCAFETTCTANERMLFRYSAVTFNAHRIHYDMEYAREVEKYPGLVVHGPLQATLLLARACEYEGRMPGRFTYRGVHPMFAHHDLTLCGYDETPDGMSLCAGVAGSHQTMSAKLTWEGAE